MALVVDASRALRSPHELTALVEAVLNASMNDESDWIEWKSRLDLREKDSQGKIARHVLGIANRRPEHASRYARGCGYIAVGVEPGNCAGVAEIDPAILGDGLQQYLGSEGPGWGLHYVSRNRTPVLMVTVEPPRIGDRIFTLQKQFAKYTAGTVFVRKPGRTVQAGPSDIRILEERFAAPNSGAVERAQRLRDLRDIGALIEHIITKAQEPDNNSSWFGNPKTWRCEEQNQLALHLIGVGRPTPKCRAVTGESGTKPVLAAARDARDEIKEALTELVAKLPFASETSPVV